MDHQDAITLTETLAGMACLTSGIIVLSRGLKAHSDLEFRTSAKPNLKARLAGASLLISGTVILLALGVHSVDRPRTEDSTALTHLLDFIGPPSPNELPDIQKLRSLQQSAEAGNLLSMVNLGMIFAKGIPGTTEKDLTKSIALFTMAAQKNFAPAKAALGECYMGGKGVARNEAIGLKLWREAAAAKEVHAMVHLGAYLSRLDSTRPDNERKGDYEEAYQLFNQARSMGNLDALANLGVMYINGTIPGSHGPDCVKGAAMFADGARQGNAPSMLYYARCLESGTGTKRNSLEAQSWYQKAALNGKPSARPSAGAESQIIYEQKLEPYPFPIFLPANIAGNTYIFELDTGATIHVVDPSLEPLLGPYRENKEVDSFGSLTEMRIYDAPVIKLGAWTLPPSAAAVTDLNHIRSHTGVNIRGYIGISAFRDCSLCFDFDSQKMSIVKGSSKAMVGMESLSINPADGAPPLIKCDIGGRTFEFMIDLGATDYVGLRHETFLAMAANGIIQISNNRINHLETGAGRTARQCGYFNQGQLLGVDLKGIPVDDTNNVNLIGLTFLQNLKCVIDLREFKFSYQRRKVLPPLRKVVLRDLHIAFPDCRNYIHGVVPGSPAAAAGVKAGDHIVRFGPIRESEINALSIYKFCVDHPGETVDLQIRHAGETELATIKLPAEESADLDRKPQ